VTGKVVPRDDRSTEERWTQGLRVLARIIAKVHLHRLNAREGAIAKGREE